MIFSGSEVFLLFSVKQKGISGGLSEDFEVYIFGSVLIYCIWWWADENKGFGGIIFAGSVENSAF